MSDKCLGIILAGGAGTRMAPMTTVVNKQLLPVYDKPMVYYPLTTLIEGGVRDVVLISQNWNLKHYESLLLAGIHFGMSIRVTKQDEPKGLAEAFPIAAAAMGRKWQDYDRICLILGDNIFHGDVGNCLREAVKKSDQANIFLSRVSDPRRYGVAEFSEGDKGTVQGIEEKPEHPKSDWAVTGLYVYPSNVLEVAAGLQPSARNELEITDVNNHYIEQGKLTAFTLLEGNAWLDSGTPEALLEASEYVRTIQDRQGRMVGCPEEAAFRNGWITAEDLRKIARDHPNSYGEYLSRLAG